MAPEVALKQPYDETIDTYSLSILIWEILSLERPFKGFNKGVPVVEHASART
jgi:serine/threonine protein kinase